jgi:hypothetical protein
MLKNTKESLLFCLHCLLCSERPLPSEIRSKLKNQVINAPWLTPGSSSQVPSIDSILTQCYSIKSWLDIQSDHIAIVHCTTGRSRSGILVGCLLKYIGAFDYASEAFDFFCRTRYDLLTVFVGCRGQHMGC